MAITEQEVHEALDSAVTNGYKAVLLSTSPEAVCEDLVECGGVPENTPLTELFPHVVSWQAKNRPKN